MDTLEEVFGPPISVYTREQALEDGFLCDVSVTAKEAGIKYPVALTHALWEACIVPDPRAVPLGQSIEGRLWDVLNLLRFAVLRGGQGEQILFKVRIIMKRAQVRDIVLKAVFGPGDEGEPVITIMQRDED